MIPIYSYKIYSYFPESSLFIFNIIATKNIYYIYNLIIYYLFYMYMRVCVHFIAFVYNIC